MGEVPETRIEAQLLSLLRENQAALAKISDRMAFTESLVRELKTTTRRSKLLMRIVAPATLIDVVLTVATIVFGFLFQSSFNAQRDVNDKFTQQQMQIKQLVDQSNLVQRRANCADANLWLTLVKLSLPQPSQPQTTEQKRAAEVFIASKQTEYTDNKCAELK